MSARRSLAALAALFVAAPLASAQELPRTLDPHPTSPAITVSDLMTRVYRLADDSMMGRAAGSPQDAAAAAYVAAELERVGLQPAGDHGGWFQEVPLSRVHWSGPRAPARNVIAILPGSDPALRGEYVSISAHNDHIGLRSQPVDHDSVRVALFARAREARGGHGGNGSDDARSWAAHALDSLRRLRAPRPDSIFNGADDDASGTAALLEIAEAMASGPRPRRSVLFISHTAEERGLVGSRWFTDHPTVPRDSIVAELDLDMVGRGTPADVVHGGPTYLELVGTRRLSTELGDLAEQVDARQPVPFVFNYAFDASGDPEEYYCRADHFNYARWGIPSINFSRGDHPDYHQVTDEPQYLDYADLARVTMFVADLARTIANLDHRVVVDKPKPDPAAPCVQ